MYMQHNTEAKL